MFAVEKLENGLLYAMKQIRKERLIENESLAAAKLEKEILSSSHHPFLVGVEYAFQTPANIYFVMKFYRYVMFSAASVVEATYTAICPL